MTMTPPASPSGSRRRAVPLNAWNASAAVASSTPQAVAATTAAVALSALCAPASFVVTRASPEGPLSRNDCPPALSLRSLIRMSAPAPVP